ncbi:hypothetical protein ACFLT7_07420 [candidate division KSB1 bacterium]
MNGCVLAGTNFGSIMVGFVFYHLVKPANQIAVQGAIAMVLSVAVFLIWSLAIKKVSGGRFSLGRGREPVQTYLLALLIFPVIFVPVHYLTQGYLTSIGNILGIWLFQAPTNILAIVSAQGLTATGPDRIYKVFREAE